MPRSLQIVIAEDEALVAEMMTGILRDLGHEVVGRALDGTQAVALTQALQPTAVLMDLSMPAMDGLEAARRIASVCPTPVVLLTAFDTPARLEEASAAGVGAYLTKPANARDLERALMIAVARFDDMRQLRRMNAELQEALRTIKLLSGILPICAHCKNIRDEQGHWQPLEDYIRSRSAVDFSHGICPLCIRAFYAEFVKET